MRSVELAWPASYSVTDHPELRQIHAATAAVRAWLVGEGARALAVTGPVGIGKTTLLTHLRDDLSQVESAAVLAQCVGTASAARHLVLRARGVAEAARRAGSSTRIVLLLDDFDLLSAVDRAAVLGLRREYPEICIVVTATYDGQLDDVITLPLRPLAGSRDVLASDLDGMRSSDTVQVFTERLRRRNPAFELERADTRSVARVCASSFGIPSEIELLAQLVDRYGLGAVCDALAENGPRRHLVELLGDLGAARPELSSDEMVVLASILAAPGGASTSMLRQSLPRCDIDASIRSLVANGLVFGTTEPDEGELGGYSSRYHLRVSAVQVASWCAGQAEVSVAAIRHAQADYLQSQIRRMAARLYTEAQPRVFAELQHELPNLRCAMSELIDIGMCSNAVTVMSEALPLLARTGGTAELLPRVLRLIRDYEPAGARERYSLAKLAVRVFLDAGEQEAAAVYLEQLVALTADGSVPCDPDITLLSILVADGLEPGVAVGTLAECLAAACSRRDMASLCEAGAEYFAHLIRAQRFDEAATACRAALSEATRSGDEYAAGLFLLWRAVAAGTGDSGGGRRYLERALAKLRPLGPAATLSAVSVLIDNRHLHDLSQSCIDLAMVIGALSRADYFWTESPATCRPVILDVEERLCRRIGVRTVQRWSAAGASADLVDVLCEVLQRRWVHNIPGAIELRRSGVPQADLVDPAALGKQSSLTARESEVASLVATGLTNKQVAFRLRISEWTVINHLRQIMRKLDCSSRVQVARWVSQVEAQ